MVVDIKAERSYTAIFDAFTMSNIMTFGFDAFSFTSDSQTLYKGGASGRLLMQGKGRMCIEGGTSQIDIESTLNGVPLPANEVAASVPVSNKIKRIRYTCAGDTATFRYDYETTSDMSAVFHRRH